MTKIIDIVGLRFGRLAVVAHSGSDRHGKRLFSCRYDCGIVKTIPAQHLRRGYTKSCGCYRVDAAKRFTTHGMSKTREWAAWVHLKDRCLNPNNPFYDRYGGRGIAVSPEWLESFEAFYRDMGPRPSKDHSVERVDGDMGYNKDNCIWATRAVQAANRSSVRLIEFAGVTDTMAGWSRRTGIPYLKLRRRIVDGWPAARALDSDYPVTGPRIG